MLQLTLPLSLGSLVYRFDFWIPPTQWEEYSPSKQSRVTRVSNIFAHARERVSSFGGHGRAYPPTKNIAEQANILEQYLATIRKLDLEGVVPWCKGKTGIMLIAQEPPKSLSSYWPGKPHTAKPDCSNILKQFEDALNPNKKTGFIGAWPDDSWVVPLYVDKQFGDIPGVQASILWFEQPNIQKPIKEKRTKKCATE